MREEERTLFLRETFSRLSENVPHLCDAMLLALSQVGQVFSSLPSDATPNGAWGRCVFLVAQHCNPNIDPRYALQVGLAADLAACGIDVQDDLIDGDCTPLITSLGRERSLLVSSALLMLSEQVLLALEDSGVETRPLREERARGILATIVGQQRDLEAEGRKLTVQEAIDLAWGKAVPFVQMTMHLGALCGGSRREQLAPYTDLAANLAMAHQIANDCHDIEPLCRRENEQVVLQKSDLIRAKGTLPLVLARQDQHATASMSTGDPWMPSPQALRTGLEAAWCVQLLYQVRTRSCLSRLEPAVSPELRMLLTGAPHA